MRRTSPAASPRSGIPTVDENPELFAFDRTRLGQVTEADPTGYIGTLEHPAQACRVVFLAAEAGAIRWDESLWPELEFGVWNEQAGSDRPRRRRAADDVSPVELSTWLQLRRSWPQLGGPGITWPLPDAPGGEDGFAERLTMLVAASVTALNTIHRRALRMARAMAEVAEPAVTPAAAAAANAEGSTVLLPKTAVPTRATVLAAASDPATGASVTAAGDAFVATAVADSERAIAEVLARLVRDVEAAAELAHPGRKPALRLDHAVTPLPALDPITGGPIHFPTANDPARFLVSLTAAPTR